mmetsp:Transcript_19291/g.28558  ORF Transcript_19291/g.28558 Transcript_19291/m.28558 type:complete len:659 (-) Transcript_19291:5326-7302(-)
MMSIKKDFSTQESDEPFADFRASSEQQTFPTIQETSISNTESSTPSSAPDPLNIGVSAAIHDSPRRRRDGSLSEKDPKKSKKKKKRKKELKEKKSAYFPSGDDGCSTDTVQVSNHNRGGEDDDHNRDSNHRRRDGRDEKGRHREELRRADSVHFLPPPPNSFSLGPNPSAVRTEVTNKTDGPFFATDEGQSTRQSAMQVREGGTTTALSSSESSTDDVFEPPSENTGNPSVIAQAELVRHDTIPTATVGPDPLTDELHTRVRMLEEEKKVDQQDDHCWPAFRSGRWPLRCLIIVLPLLLGVTVAAVAYMMGRASAIIRTESPTPTPTLQPSASPSLYPTTVPSFVPTLEPTVDLERMWVSFIQSVSPATEFNNTESPERIALDWMLQDPFTVSVFDDANRVRQRFALAVFFFATGEIQRGWLDEDVTECNWLIQGSYGSALTCNFADEIIGMDFSGSRLGGTIPKEIALLSELSSLVLNDNGFEGTIPTEIGKLSRLKSIELGFIESLTGTIPTEIGELTALTQMYFSYMGMEGTIPTEIGRLTNCDFFAAFDINLNGTIPSEVGLMTSLSFFDVSMNRDLTGPLPTELGILTSVDHMHLYDTGLSGSMPSSLCERGSDWISLMIECDRIICICCCASYECTPCDGTSASPAASPGTL